MSYRTKLSTCVFAAISLLAISIPARASFVGDTVTANYEWPNLGTILYPGGTSVIASGGTTFDLSSGGVIVDVTNSNILITFPGGWGFSTAPKTFDGIVVNDPSADITAVSLASTNIAGYVASDLSFDGQDVYINFPYPPFSGLSAGASVSVDVSFATPEPAPMALLAAGLLGIGLLCARRVTALRRSEPKA
jgi:hypothetical protein